MALILNPVVIAGGRVSWDRELSPLIAQWLRMMAERDARQYLAVASQSITEPSKTDGPVLNRLKARYAATLRLIRHLDESWDCDDWESAGVWVMDLIREHNVNPGTTPETGNPDSDSERPGPGT